MGQEVVRITDHLGDLVGRKCVGVGLVRAQRPTVTSDEIAVVADLNNDDIFQCHVVNDIQEWLEMETWRYDICLWTVLTMGVK